MGRVEVLARRPVGEVVRVGAQHDGREDRGRPDEGDRDEVRAGELGEADRRREGAGGCHQVRSDDGADRRAPHDDADRRRASIGRVHVGGGVARELVRGVAEPDQDRSGEEGRERGGDDPERGDDRADDRDDVAEGQPEAATAPDHDAGEDDGARCRSKHDRSAGHARPDRGSAEVLGDDGCDGDRRDMPGAAEGDARDERPRGPAPRLGEVRDRQVELVGGHRGRIRGAAGHRPSPTGSLGPTTVVVAHPLV